MSLISFYNYYKIGRLVFALTLLISLQMTEILNKNLLLFLMLIIYLFIAFIRLIINKETLFYADFLLDISLITGILHFNISTYSFLTLFYLLPIFLSSVLMKSRWLFLFPTFASLLYILSYYLNSLILSSEGIINVLLHGFSFYIIAFAGNAMRDKIDTQGRYIKILEDEKIRMESYKRLYRVSADLAHELRNPLATISASVQFLKEGRNDPELIDMLSKETSRLINLANDFLVYSRPEESPKENVDIADVIKILIAHKNSSKKIMFEIRDDAIVTGNRTYLEAALDNIIKNAIEAAHSTVMITINNNSSNVIIDIEDDGTGIEESLRDRVFDPFFTTKQTGTGLGLSISNRIIGSFGGTIMCNKSQIGGAKFTVILPLTKRINYESFDN